MSTAKLLTKISALNPCDERRFYPKDASADGHISRARLTSSVSATVNQFLEVNKEAQADFHTPYI